MTTPIDPYASATAGLPVATSSQIPVSAIGQFGATVNSAQINLDSTTNWTGVYGYLGPPGLGNLYFALVPSAGTDSYGNTVSSGLNVVTGSVTGVSLTGITMDSTSTLVGTNVQNPNVLNPNIAGGTAVSMVATMTNDQGGVLGYYTGLVSETFTTSQLWTVPSGVTVLQVECWGAGGGGNGSSETQGASGGGGGEYAAEPTYAVTPGDVYYIQVGVGGAPGHPGTSFGSAGGAGGMTQFFAESSEGNQLKVTANGGSAAEGNWLGGGGGTGSVNTIHFDGGDGANSAGAGNSGGSGGGGSASPEGEGNPGSTASGDTGGAGGTALVNGGAGGDGGNQGASGAAAGAPGGGGGGCGSGLSSLKTYTANITTTNCYRGPDATTDPNVRYNYLGTCYQGYTSGAAFGHMYTYLKLPYAEIEDILATGAVVQSIELTLTNNYSWFAVGMYVNLGFSADYDFGDDGDAGKDNTPIANYHVPQDAAYTYNMGTVTSNGVNIATALANGDAKSFLLGPYVAIGTGAEGLNYAGTFYGGSSSNCPVFTMNYYPNDEAQIAASPGANGQVVLTYGASTPTYVLSVSATSGLDLYNNPLEAGFAGPAVIIPGGGNTAATLTAGGLTVPTSVNSGEVGSAANATGLYAQQLELPGRTAVPATASSGPVAYGNLHGDLKYVSGNDGNAFNTGKMYNVLTSGVAVNTTANTSILSVNLGVGYYYFETQIACVSSGSSGEPVVLANQGTVELNFTISAGQWNMDDQTAVPVNAQSSTTGLPGGAGGYSWTASGQAQNYSLSGIIDVSSSGTLVISARASTTSAYFTVSAGSYVAISPISEDP